MMIRALLLIFLFCFSALLAAENTRKQKDENTDESIDEIMDEDFIAFLLQWSDDELSQESISLFESIMELEFKPQAKTADANAE